MRWIVARRTGRRGVGFGNEAIPWAKGWIASQVLDARLVGPSWGLSRYRYDRHFGTSRTDFLAEELLARAPHYEFSEAEYRATGEINFGLAIHKWAVQRDLLKRRSFVVSVAGMWGGYAAIGQARLFLLSRLLNSRGALRNVNQALSALDPRKLFVAVHFRSLGEFKSTEAGEDVRGQFNMKVPADWYHHVCGKLQAHFGDRVQFLFLTDRGSSDFDALVARFNPGQTKQVDLTEMSDLLLLSQADLRVCSVSSYSMLASFLAAGPYAWYEPQLELNNGVYSLWGHEEAQSRSGGLTYENALKARQLPTVEAIADHLRGYPVRAEGELPSGLIHQLRERLGAKDFSTDLLQYGAVPAWAIAGAEETEGSYKAHG